MSESTQLLYDQAIAFHLENNFVKAESLYLQLLEQDLANAEINFLLGSLYFQTEQYLNAIQYLNKAVALAFQSFEVYSHLALSYYKVEAIEDAIRCFHKTLEFQANNAKSHLYLGELYLKKNDFQQALQYYQKSLKIYAQDAIACHGVGMCLVKLKQPVEALAWFQKALELDPNNVSILHNIASMLCHVGRVQEGLSYFKKLLDINNTLSFPWSNWLCLLHYSQYFSLEQINEQNILYQKKVDELYPKEKWLCKRKYNDVIPMKMGIQTDTNRKVRLGYFSPDFRTHSVAYFLLPILQHHNRAQFEIYAYANVTKPDTMTEKFKSMVDQWHDVATLADDALVKLMAEDQLDILIDLAGHTEDNRTLVMAQKPAPIQINYLGYPATSAITAMDYRITDIWADPAATPQFYTETLLRMPHGFLCYQPNQMVGAGFPRPQWMGGETPPLPSQQKGHITFGCFNNLLKINTDMVKVWSKILRPLPNAKLLLKNLVFNHARVRQYYLNLFAAENIAAEQLLLQGWIDDTQHHLTLYDEVDIALDTYPYHGTTTTCEALSMGVPVVSWAGTTHASRVGLSLLTQIGHPELVAFSEAEYIQKAVELALDQHRLKNYHQQLSKKLVDSSLCNAKQFTLDFENLLCHAISTLPLGCD